MPKLRLFPLSTSQQRRTTAEYPYVIDLEQERTTLLSFEFVLNDHRSTKGELLRLAVQQMTILRAVRISIAWFTTALRLALSVICS